MLYTNENPQKIFGAHSQKHTKVKVWKMNIIHRGHSDNILCKKKKEKWCNRQKKRIKAAQEKEVQLNCRITLKKRNTLRALLQMQLCPV